MTATFLCVVNEITGVCQRIPLSFTLNEAIQRMREQIGPQDQLCEDPTNWAYVRVIGDHLLLTLFDESTEGDLADRKKRLHAEWLCEEEGRVYA
ncbi:MAG TPA: hypothetical protein VJL29_00630 [Thermoguttaceae bacterium]|nr:hypothetical protein [Thermoguttaceae bacterium]